GGALPTQAEIAALGEPLFGFFLVREAFHEPDQRYGAEASRVDQPFTAKGEALVAGADPHLETAWRAGKVFDPMAQAEQGAMILRFTRQGGHQSVAVDNAAVRRMQRLGGVQPGFLTGQLSGTDERQTGGTA